jgi:hypothetical protein
MNMRGFTMPTRRLDYLLMGIIAGIFAGLICVYILGITYFELLRVGQSIRESFKIAPKGQIINCIRLISNI